MEIVLDKCCVKGSLLEVNDRLIKQPELLKSSVRITYLPFFTGFQFIYVHKLNACNLYMWKRVISMICYNVANGCLVCELQTLQFV